jgi:hypothetical protein
MPRPASGLAHPWFAAHDEASALQRPHSVDENVDPFSLAPATVEHVGSPGLVGCRRPCLIRLRIGGVNRHCAAAFLGVLP